MKLLVSRSKAGQAARDPEPDRKVRSATSDRRSRRSNRRRRRERFAGAARERAAPRVQPPPVSEELAFVWAIDVSNVIARAPPAPSPPRAAAYVIGASFRADRRGLRRRDPRPVRAGAGDRRREKRTGKCAFFRVLRGGVKRNRRSRSVPWACSARTGKGAIERWWIPILDGPFSNRWEPASIHPY